MINSSQHLADNLASLLEYAHHDTEELKGVEVDRFTPSVTYGRSYMGVKAGNKHFLIQIDEVSEDERDRRV